MRSHCFSSQAFDYGREGNLKHYGTETPINFMENYDQYVIIYFIRCGRNSELFLLGFVQNRYSHLLCHGLERYPHRTHQCYHPIRSFKRQTS
jgi:hypothetical protein